jgi:hypothetical protein
LESVVIVTYLAKADGTPLSRDWVSEKMLPLGDAYFRGPHQIPFEMILGAFEENETAFAAQAERLGATAIDYGDFGVEIPALPMVPFRLGLWRSDEEFGAEGKVLFDRTADRYLILDGLLTLLNIVFKRLSQ